MSTKFFLFKPLVIACVFTFFQPLVSAQNLDAGLFYAIDEINTGKTKFNPTAAQCLTETQLREFEVASEDLKYRQQCARALCGSPNIVSSVYVDKKNIESYLTPAFKYRIEELRPKLKAATEAIRKAKKDAIKTAEQNLFKDGKLNFNPKSWENTDALTEINKRTFEKYLQMKVDPSAPIGKKISFQIATNSSIPAGILPGLNEYKARIEKHKNSNPDTLLKYNLLSKDDVKNYIKFQIATYEEFIAKENRKSNIDRKGLDSAKKAIKNLKDSLNKQTASPRDALINVTADLYDLEETATKIDPNFVGGMTQKACSSPACMSAYQAYFQSINAKDIFNNYKTGLDDPKVFDRSMSRCIANMVASETMLSSQEKAEKLFAEVLPSVLKNVVGKFSDGTRKYYEGYFAKQFEISSKMLTSGVSSGAKPFERYDKVLDSITASPNVSDYDEAITLNEIIRHSDGEIPNPLASSDFCNSDPVANAWDAFLSIERAKSIIKAQGGDAGFNLPGKDTLYVSPFTCTHAKPGKSIIAHELGHAINDGFLRKKSSSHSTQIFLKLRKCISSNHAQNQSPLDESELSFSGDYVKSEEDTADVLAFMAYKDDKDLFTCSLLKQDDSGSKFVDLYVAEDTESNHSPAFYRLMMEALNKGISLPPSCQMVVERSKSLIGFQKCVE